MMTPQDIPRVERFMQSLFWPSLIWVVGMSSHYVWTTFTWDDYVTLVTVVVSIVAVLSLSVTGMMWLIDRSGGQ